MRTFALAAMAAVTNGLRAHEFFAENNYICELCTSAVKFAASGRDIELGRLYEQFPKLEERINHFSN